MLGDIAREKAMVFYAKRLLAPSLNCLPCRQKYENLQLLLPAYVVPAFILSNKLCADAGGLS
jgi:hypothetical protein